MNSDTARLGSRAGRRRRPSATALVALLLAAGLAGCGPAEPSADDAADRLAAGIESGSVRGLDFANVTPAAAQNHLTAVFEPIAADPHTVTVRDVTVDDTGAEKGRHATATLAYSWDLGPAKKWTYTTTVGLSKQAAPEGSTSNGEVWATTWEPEVLAPGLGQGDRLAVSRLQAARGDIVGADDQVLVTSRPVQHIGLDKTHVAPEKQRASARALAAAVKIDADAYAARVAKAGPKAFVEAITIRTGDPSVDMAAVQAVEGVGVLDDELPLAPTAGFARPILGRVGAATAEIIEDSDGAVVAGDVVGLSGLQRQYDEQLRGTPGVVVRIIPDGSGGPEDKPVEAFRAAAVAGEPLRITLREDMQANAEAILAGQTSPSAIVAIRPSTGAVLAAASGTASEGMSTATLGLYAPGSTFKVATTLALLRAGLTPESVVPCTEAITVGGRTFHNVPGYPASALGEVPLRTAFANSCNTAMISQAGKASQQDLHAAAADLGLGVDLHLGAPGASGKVPAKAGTTEHAASMIGQGAITASPLGMATVAASVAAGKRVAPVLVVGVDAGQGAATAAQVAHVRSGAARVGGDATGGSGASGGGGDGAPSGDAQPAGDGLTEAEAATLRSLMRSVVTDGSATVLTPLPGEVGAKTGTAQYGDGSQAHAWMIATQGDLAVAVFVETGATGATTAGPLMKQFLAGPYDVGE